MKRKKGNEKKSVTSAERISDALGEIDPALVAETDEKRAQKASADRTRRAKRKKIFRAAAAAAAVLCVGFAAVKLVPGIPMRVCALETAEYPTMAPYPTLAQDIVQGIFSGFRFDTARKKWQESRNAVRDTESSRSVSPELYAFAERTLSAFLTSENGENAVCSPVNVYLASAMLAEITDGVSRAELLSMLGTDNMTEARNLASGAWRQCYNDDGAHTAIPASSLWLDSGLSPDGEVLKTLADTYFASSFSGNMGGGMLDAAFRAWLDGQTGGMLSDNIGKLGFTDEDRVAIASTLQFSAKWSSKFKEGNTEDGIFHSPLGDITVPYLHKKRSAHTYFVSGQFAAVYESFEGSGMMWLILPDEGITPGDLLSDPALYDMLSDPYPGYWNEEGIYVTGDDVLFASKSLLVNLAVPRFDVTGNCDLREAFRELGVTSVLSQETADFSPLSDEPDLFLSSAEHAARVKIDEEGCTAASYVVMKGSGAAMPPEEEVDFILDRPFLFVITEGDLPLYVGIVNQP